MPTWKDAVAIARTLPEVEVSTWYGTPGLKVAGKGFARLRTEAEGGLVLMCTLEEKARLLESGEPAYYTTPHYDGYGSIIVNLAIVHPDALHELIVRAWYLKAAPRLRPVLKLQPALRSSGPVAPRKRSSRSTAKGRPGRPRRS